MSHRAPAWLAWSLAGLSAAMSLASLLLYAGGAPGELLLQSINVPFLAFPLVGALIASRRPGNLIGWICLAVGFLWMFIGLSEGYIAYGISEPGSLPFVVMVAALTDWLWFPTVGLLGTYLLLLFPNGRLPSRRWRSLAWLTGAVIVLLGVAGVLAPGPLGNLEGGRNPFGLEGAPWLNAAEIALLLLLVACVLASALSLVLRYRRSGGEVREQIKWIALAGSSVGLLLLGAILGVLIVEGTRADSALPLWLQALIFVMLLGFAGVPLAIGVAVLKYRLYAIDLFINRALVYGVLTVTLALTYFAGVTATQAAFRVLTGQEEQRQLAVVISTLTIAALLGPLRRRIQYFIDRRFYRRKYDAARTLEAFSARLRNETDLDTLRDDVVGVVRATMQPKNVGLWLRSSATRGGACQQSVREPAELARERPEPYAL